MCDACLVGEGGHFCSDAKYHGLRLKIGPRSWPATDQEIDVVARTIVDLLQQSNWVIERGPTRAGRCKQWSARLVMATFILLGLLGLFSASNGMAMRERMPGTARPQEKRAPDPPFEFLNCEGIFTGL
jgi:hypothetical protein